MSWMYHGPGQDDPRPDWPPAMSALCAQQGCQLSTAQKVMDQAEALLKETEYQNFVAQRGRKLEDMMSQALWCDSGEHAFSERDPDRQHLERTAYDASGNQITEPVDVCGACAQQNGLLKPRTLYPRPDSNESTRAPQDPAARGLAPGQPPQRQ